MTTIFQAYQTIEQVNGTGVIGILQTDAQAVPFLPALILFAIFVILALGSYFSNLRRLGRGDLPASFAVAGLVTVVVGILMSLIPNFINSTTLGIAIILEIIFAFWLFLSRD